MIRYHIPVEYAEAVRAALAPCNYGTFQDKDEDECGIPECWHSPCRRAPSFWWGVKLRPNWEGGNTDVSNPFILPAVVQEMLDGRPLVELVTDCKWRPGWCDDDRCTDCAGTGTVSLGVVTATELLPITTDQVFPDKPSIIVKSPIMVIQQQPRHWDGEGMTGPVTLLGPSDALHAIHMTGVER